MYLTASEKKYFNSIKKSRFNENFLLGCGCHVGSCNQQDNY